MFRSVNSHLLSSLVAALALQTGCIGEEEDTPDVRLLEQAAMNNGMNGLNIGGNGLNLGSNGINIGGNGFNLGSNGLNTGSNGLNLGSNGLNLGSNGLNLGSNGFNSGGSINTGAAGWQDFVQLMQYVVSCALPEDVTLYASTDTGVTYTFQGLYGLAPEWKNGPCTAVCQRWVSACLLARTNPTGQKVRISLRGPHPRLSTWSPDDANFPIREAVFYGNLFVDPPLAYASPSVSIMNMNFQSTYVQKRICGHSIVACGIVKVGEAAEKMNGRNLSWACNDETGPAPESSYLTGCYTKAQPACSSSYSGCSPGLTWPEAITVNLERDVCGDGVCSMAESVYQTCGTDCNVSGSGGSGYGGYSSGK